MAGFVETLACHSRTHCNACRTNAVWRVNVGAPDECPEGHTAEKIPSRGLGDTLAKFTKAVGIKPCKGCKKRIEWINEKIPYKAKTA